MNLGHALARRARASIHTAPRPVESDLDRQRNREHRHLLRRFAERMPAPFQQGKPWTHLIGPERYADLCEEFNAEAGWGTPRWGRTNYRTYWHEQAKAEGRDEDSVTDQLWEECGLA